MRKFFLFLNFLALGIALTATFQAFFVYAQSNSTSNSSSSVATDLKSAIDAKSEELKKINEEITKTKSNINTTKVQGKALQKEVNNLSSNINELSLRVRAGEITVEKLKLELQDLNLNIDETEKDIATKKENIGFLLRRMQQKDDESFIISLLKNDSLADTVVEAQNLSDINGGLHAAIISLNEVDAILNEKVNSASKKKSSIEVETSNNKNRQVIVTNTKIEREKLLKLTSAQQKEYEAQLNELTKKQTEFASEIEKLESELRAKIDPNSVPRARPGLLEFPVPGGTITQGYGATSFALQTYAGKWHNALDIGRFLGAEIVSAEDGTVVGLDDQDKYCPRVAYGKYIVIKHTNGLTSLYAHMSRQLVSVGQSVKRGELIGYMGKTGWATGPHVHFSVFLSSSFTLKQSRFCGLMPVGADLDPRKYLNI